MSVATGPGPRTSTTGAITPRVNVPFTASSVRRQRRHGRFTDKISETNCPIPNTDIHSEKTDISTENRQLVPVELIHPMNTAYFN